MFQFTELGGLVMGFESWKCLLEREGAVPILQMKTTEGKAATISRTGLPVLSNEEHGRWGEEGGVVRSLGISRAVGSPGLRNN